MRKINILVLIIFSAFLLISCDDNNSDDHAIPEDAATIEGVVTDVGDRIAILVTEGAYEDQPLHVLISSETDFVNKNGNRTTKDSINVGDRILVYHSGQIMMSYPGQVSALRIDVK